MTAPDTDHAATRDDVFSWLHNMQHDDTPEYLSEAADLVLSAYDALQRERDEARRELAAERARVGRIKDLLFAVNDLAIAVVDLLTDEQVEGPDYPNDLDERHAELANVCRAFGDLDRDLTPDEGVDDE